MSNQIYPLPLATIHNITINKTIASIVAVSFPLHENTPPDVL